MRTRANLVMRLCLLAPVYLVRRIKKKERIYRRITKCQVVLYNRHRIEYYYTREHECDNGLYSKSSILNISIANSSAKFYFVD